MFDRMTDAQAAEMFTPSAEEQLFNILQGKCPHAMVWIHIGAQVRGTAPLWLCSGCGLTQEQPVPNR